MALFQEWHLLNNIDDNISLLEKLLNNKHNNYYYLSEIELEELYDKLNDYIKFKILIKIRDNKNDEKELIYKNKIIELKRKIKNKNNYINLIYLNIIIIVFLIINFYLDYYYYYYY